MKNLFTSVWMLFTTSPIHFIRDNAVFNSLEKWQHLITSPRLKLTIYITLLITKLTWFGSNLMWSLTKNETIRDLWLWHKQLSDAFTYISR